MTLGIDEPCGLNDLIERVEALERVAHAPVDLTAVIAERVAQQAGACAQERELRARINELEAALRHMSEYLLSVVEDGRVPTGEPASVSCFLGRQQLAIELLDELDELPIMESLR